LRFFPTDRPRHEARTPRVLTALALASFLACAQPAMAQELPVNLEAKSLVHDEKTQDVTAEGDVQFMQGDNILNADKVVYNLGTDSVRAIGNVSIMDAKGNIHFAEYIELSGDLKDGFVQGLLSLLADGSRFTAVEGRREGGTRLTMTEASYTPCTVCEVNPDPLWQIKADKVVHDTEKKSVTYENARLEVKGVPIAFSPVFAHADPTVKRKSGFLRPDYGWSDDLGTYVQAGYYFGDISPDMDATVQLRPTSLAGVQALGQWRQRFTDGRLEINASGVRSDRKEENGSIEENRIRGHVFADGLFDLNREWRAGFKLQRASDKGYLRLYDIASDNVLESEAYAERFSGRDYSRVALMDFQDVRLGLRPDQPMVVPRMEHRMFGEPGQLGGGRWTFGTSALGLLRRGDDQDVQRITADTGWERRDVTQAGIVTRVNLAGRADLYKLKDSDAAVIDPAADENTQDLRGMAVASVTAGYPMVRRFEKSQMVVEPVVSASLSPGIDSRDTDVPNEDSVDIQLDANNLFSDNRFPGIDRQEDGARVSYGVKTGVYGDNGRYGKVFVGQSYRFNDDAVFAEGSGLDQNSSDLVGQASVGLSRYFNADYRVQVDSEDLTFNRHELQATGGNDTFNLDMGYIFLAAVEGTGFDETREQLRAGGQYHLNKEWWVNAHALQDLGEDPGLRRAGVGLNYADECFTFSLQGARNLIDDASGESGTVVMMRIGFKNIGEFTTPSILLGDAEEISQ
jgi:LPS-assembly protein